MPQYSTGGQFGGSPYNNPQMNQAKPPQWGGFSGYGQAPQAGQGWGNTASPNYQWQQNWRPDQAAWIGGTPGRQGQTLSYNPQTGEQEWVNDPSGLSFGMGAGHTSAGTGQVSWIDPTTGQRMIDPLAIQNAFGLSGGGASGGANYQSYSGSPYSGGGDVTPGAGWGGYDYQQSSVDPSAVIAAQEPRLQEQMKADMAQAGARAGQSGFAMSTPYMGQLGEAARKAAQDRNALTMQYQYDAAQQDAARQQQQQMQAAQHAFGGWGTGYQGDLSAQMFNEGQNFQGWLANQQMGMQDARDRNQWNLAQQQMGQDQNLLNQQLMASLIGGLF